MKTGSSTASSLHPVTYSLLANLPYCLCLNTSKFTFLASCHIFYLKINPIAKNGFKIKSKTA